MLSRVKNHINCLYSWSCTLKMVLSPSPAGRSVLVHAPFYVCIFLVLTEQIEYYRTAIKDLSIGLSIESSNIECLYLRASCYHAVGQYREAVCWLFSSLCYFLPTVFGVIFLIVSGIWYLKSHVLVKIKDYDAALDLELDSMEKFVLQCLAFYQVRFFVWDVNYVQEKVISWNFFKATVPCVWSSEGSSLIFLLLINGSLLQLYK